MEVSQIEDGGGFMRTLKKKKEKSSEQTLKVFCVENFGLPFTLCREGEYRVCG